MKGKTEEVKSFNAYLETIEFRVYEIRRQLISSGDDASGSKIKNEFLGVSERPRMLKEILIDELASKEEFYFKLD